MNQFKLTSRLCLAVFITAQLCHAQFVSFFSESLTSDPGWTVDGQWAFGVPQGLGSRADPSAGFTGTNVYGYNLAGEYSNNISTVHYLTTTPIDCSAFSLVQLEFRRWLGVENDSWDHATIEVSNDGGIWADVWTNTVSFQDTSWQLINHDISAVAGGQPAVQIRWSLGTTDGSVTYSGWNIDDVELLGLPPNAQIIDVQFSTSDHESVTPRIVTVSRTGNTNDPALVNYATADGTAIAGSDYLTATGQLSFAAGELLKTIPVTILNDSTTESSESFDVNVWTEPGETNIFLVTTNMTLTILDDDNVVLSLSYVASAGEAQAARDIVISRSLNTGVGFNVNYTASNGTAIAGQDFTALAGQVQFNSGDLSKTVTVTVIDDALIEDDEFFSVHLTTDPGSSNTFTWLQPSSFDLIITDNDYVITDFPFYDGFESSVISNYWNPYSSLPEGRIQITTNDVPRSGTQHIVLDRTPSGALNLNELNLGINLEGQSDVILSFSAKHFSDERTSIPAQFSGHYNGDGLSISTNGSSWYRLDGFSTLSANYQDFSIDLDAAIASLGIGYSSNTFIRFQQYDNFPVPTDGISFDEISLRQNNPTLSFLNGQHVFPETNATFTIPIIREIVIGTAVTVDYAITGGTASNGLDYILAATGSVFFAAGETTNSLSVTILDELIDEPDETITIALSAPTSGISLGSIDTTTIIIEANDGPGRFRLSTNQYSITEGGGMVGISVERIGGSVGTAGVTFSTFAGTATPGMDFSSITTNLVFGDGVILQTVQVPILEDASTEGLETFEVFLSIPTGGANLDVPNVASVQIIDNELNFFQGFELSGSDNWNYTIVANNGSSATRSTDKSMEGSFSLDFNGSNNSNGDPYIEFTNVMIAGLVNVKLSVAFATDGADTADDLYLDISYDNGSVWESTKLVDGYNNAMVEFGATNDVNPTTVAPNPYIVPIPDDKKPNSGSCSL